MGRLVKFFLTLLLAGALLVLNQLVSFIVYFDQTPLLTAVFLVCSAVIIALFIFVGSRFKFLGEKTNMFERFKGEFSGKNIGLIVAGVFLMRILAVAFTVMMQGKQTLNDQGIQDVLTNVPIISMFVLLCVIAPVCEEIIFRGVFFNGVFRDKQGEQLSLKMDVLGVVVTSFLFSSVHLSADIISFLMYFSLGVVLCIVYLVTKSLKCSMIVHFINNFIPFLGLVFLM